MLTMYKQITIKTLHKQGAKNAEIATQLGCHRNTVFNVIQRSHVLEQQTRQKPSLFDPYKLQIKEWLDQKITRLRIYEKLQEEHTVECAYDTLCKYIQRQFPKTPEAFGVQVVSPGEVAEIDFGYLGMLPDDSGKLVKTFGLAVVLGYSRLDYYAICSDQKLETLCAGLQDAFTYFGGVPKRLKVDNMKTAVLKNQHYDLTLNQDFLEFANHYGTVITPCEPYHPEQKGKVEGAIKYLQINFVAGRTFEDSSDLKKQASIWTQEYANKRVHGTTKKVPMEVFRAQEQEKLQPLPSEAFAVFNRGLRKVSTNCHIHFENNYYSVPSVLVGREITVRWNKHLLRVIYQGEQVALHHVASGQGNYVTVRHHMPDYKVYSATEYQKRYEEKMSEIGEDAHAYFKMLLETKESYWFRIVRIILGLNETYGNMALNRTLKRALYYNATDTVTIRNILEKKLYLLETEPKLLEKTEPVTVDGESSLTRAMDYYTTEVAS